MQLKSNQVVTAVIIIIKRRAEEVSKRLGKNLYSQYNHEQEIARRMRERWRRSKSLRIQKCFGT
jgi:hypothetical protein